MKKYRITLSINGVTKEFIMTRNNSDIAPNDDFILRNFSKHYQAASKRTSLPPDSKVISIKEI